MKVVHFGSYWMGENDVVKLMVKALHEIYEIKEVDTRIYNDPNEWCALDFRFNRNNAIKWLKHNKVLDLIDDDCEFVVVNSGGMSLCPETIKILKDRNVVVIGISLSDPDVFPYHAKHYSCFYDLYYTNSKYSLHNDYVDTNIKLMPFAAYEKLHRPLNIEEIYDIIVVGHAQSHRIEVVNNLRKYYRVGVFGNGWEQGNGLVNGENHVRAINSGKIYLSFAKTTAGFTNVKVGVFEAAACRRCIVTDTFDEMSDYFKYGRDVLGSSDSNLLDVISECLADKKYEFYANCAYNVCLKRHTWKIRWQNVLRDVQNIREGRRNV